MNKERLPQSITVLLGAVLFMNTGSFMIMPFLAIYLSSDLHFMSWQVGTVLTTILVTQRGVPIFTGFLGDRGSHRINVIAGVIVRALGFGGLIVAHEFWSIVIAAVFVGFGGALFDPSVSAFFSAQPETIRKKTFTYFNQMLNSGVIVGPLIGAVFVAFDPVYPFTIAGATMIVVAIAIMLYSKQLPATVKDDRKIVDSLKVTFSNTPFLLFLAVLTLFWMMFSQLNISFPVKGYDLTSNKQLVSSIFVLNGVAGLCLMFFLRKFFLTKNPLTMVKAGVILMGVAIALIGLVPSIYWLLVCVFFYTVGETLALPGAEMTVAQFSNNKPAGLFFGLFQASWAIGGSIGNYIGAWVNKVNDTFWSWLLFLVIGVAAALCFQLLDKRMKIDQQPNHKAG
ncbi:hypothetical protein A374_16313 [Fictibacillus macauensis ZFHKF-1]|uniref:Major facilitator superfamily (MFS) profile domain-containing protein n=1 Tax=Fictibacillus macauensis ZFHKF-1 TaxID=1196324 RepID=I8AFF7_9BACL|nr:MFS transporter [Fictibacillus macauensis]EIT84367.1 hypothetical protein A374_16313 [Fictibacillus macauensis ZFHKF-1]